MTTTVRLRPVMDAGHRVWRICDESGYSMRVGLVASREFAEQECRRRQWALSSEDLPLEAVRQPALPGAEC